MFSNIFSIFIKCWLLKVFSQHLSLLWFFISFTCHMNFATSWKMLFDFDLKITHGLTNVNLVTEKIKLVYNTSLLWKSDTVYFTSRLITALDKKVTLGFIVKQGGSVNNFTLFVIKAIGEGVNYVFYKLILFYRVFTKL